jgi:hypothetical protein
MDLNKILNICRAHGVEMNFRYERFSNSLVMKFYNPENNMYFQQYVSVSEMYGYAEPELVMDCVIEMALRGVGAKV